MMNIGKAIKLCRVQRNLTQKELAERADISKSYLSLIERGKRDPTFSTVEDIATALNVPTSILVFLAADGEELELVNADLAEKLSHTALRLIRESNEEIKLPEQANSNSYIAR
jgi:transcriptional regulator with XRE-family HTH domain